MNLYIKYDTPATCKKVLQDVLEKHKLNYSLVSLWEVELKETLSDSMLNELTTGLNNYGIEIVESHKSILVQKIKDAI